MSITAYVGIGVTFAGTAVGAGVLFWRATNAQLIANAELAIAQALSVKAQAEKTDEERRGVATDNAKDLIDLMKSMMSEQTAHFATEVGHMKIQAEQMNLASLKDSETIRNLRSLAEEERIAHKAEMEEERRRCDRAMEELHLRIDLLSKQIQAMQQTHVPLEGIAAGTPVIITPVQEGD